MLSDTRLTADIFQLADSRIFRDPVDLSVLAGYESIQLDGETDLVVELIDLYFDEVPRRVQAMREAMRLTDGKSLASAAHALRGSSGNLGALQVAQICTEIEGLGSVEKWSHLPSLLSWLELECEIALHIFMQERRTRMR
ncbi:MAG TPA: Hpt domain-containing protein [Pyrinomonadaceae bacterium]|nr:Hpt domain-containing protein [Pyrinomonadaceae bacterium]